MIQARRAFIALTNDGWVVVRVVVCGVPLWFFFILGLHGDTFATGGGTYRAMQALMSEGCWSLMSGVVAALGISAWWTRSYAYWLTTTVLLSAWHGLVALLVLQSNPITTGTGPYALLAWAATMKILRPHGSHVSRSDGDAPPAS